ncbi:MAG: hypothetical protein J7K77_02530 [Dehalococcoidales bacterium]|nr:hypothetical protein [Dehalococcoidales bacterium]
MRKISTAGSVFVSVFGIIVLVFGIMEFVVLGRYGVEGVCWGPLEMSGMWLWWTGIILVGAGIMYMSSANNFESNIHQLAKSVVASIMIWIMAGMAIFDKVAGSIPGEEVWVNPPADFLAGCGPPFTPAIFLLPVSLVIIYFIRQRHRASPNTSSEHLVEE